MPERAGGAGGGKDEGGQMMDDAKMPPKIRAKKRHSASNFVSAISELLGLLGLLSLLSPVFDRLFRMWHVPQINGQLTTEN